MAEHEQRFSRDLPGNERLVAVIDLGTSSVRMAIAEMAPDGEVNTLESMQQAVSVGKDTFTVGEISKASTEQCVQVLRSFKRMLDEYGIADKRNIHAVATSAVREAANRQAFLDRIYIATGIDIKTIDEAEVNRYTYLSVQSRLREEKFFKKGRVLLVEVGGGSTELLLIDHRQVTFSKTYRLGSLRMRQMLMDIRTPVARVGSILRKHIHGVIAQIPSQLPVSGDAQLLALGGDARFAALQINPDWDRTKPLALAVNELRKLTDYVLTFSVDEIAQRYHLSIPSAETLGPALLGYVCMADMLEMKKILVAGETLRDGLLLEMGSHEAWMPDYTAQVIHAAIELGRKYTFDQAHAEQVAYLGRKLFRALRDEHRLPDKYEVILEAASLLHEVGRFINDRSHHKHSMYIIQNSDLFGVGAEELNLIALVARYHRKAVPNPAHPGYDRLSKDDRVVVCKLAAILRVADALETGHARRIRKIDLRSTPDEIVISIRNVMDLSLENIALQRKGELFEQTYGKRILLRPVRKGS
ncbi:MAG: Ppx/GppA family phosphatase [Spartobacteria bacterium]|nr:Ppx/GppA family phosphatase [Spartobacteria bacterium]